MAERLYPNITLLLEILLFVAVFLILSRFLFAPVLEILRQRRKKIEGQREDTNNLKIRTVSLSEEYNSRLTQAKRKASVIVEGLKKEGEDAGKEMISRAKAENERLYNEYKQRVWADAERLRKDLASTAEEVSNDLSSKILQ